MMPVNQIQTTGANQDILIRNNLAPKFEASEGDRTCATKLFSRFNLADIPIARDKQRRFCQMFTSVTSPKYNRSSIDCSERQCVGEIEGLPAWW
mmetsp:Transcript_24551/g.36783  ORF Transcript_24551/g.36783 Transcript_24551/m.36783 type:complete len:94 (+) Transcript_24551:219-500(+)